MATTTQRTNVDLTTVAAKALKSLKDETSIDGKTIASKAIIWLAKQQQTKRLEVLGLLPPSKD